MKRFESVKYSDKQMELSENIKEKAIELEKAINAVRINGGKNIVQNYLESALLSLEVCVMVANKGISRNDKFL